jgi:hypothetical protein
MKGQDGRDYTFRSIDKDPSQILPEELRDTWVRNIVQDQMVAQHPAGALVVDDLQEPAGILRTPQHLVVMPDDPVLGEFRREFAGVVGGLRVPGAVEGTRLPRRDRDTQATSFTSTSCQPRQRADARARSSRRGCSTHDRGLGSPP